MKNSIVLLLILCSVPFSNALAMRCSHKLIQIGDYKAEVFHLCGEPDYADVRYVTEGNRLRSPDRVLEFSRYEEIEVEEWTYNFGSTKLMRLLIFENGVLKQIRAMGYGY